MAKSEKQNRTLVVSDRPWIKIKVAELQLLMRDFAEARDNRPTLLNIMSLVVASVPVILNTFPNTIYGISGETVRGGYTSAVGILFIISFMKYTRHFFWRFLIKKLPATEYRPDEKVQQIIKNSK